MTRKQKKQQRLQEAKQKVETQNVKLYNIIGAGVTLFQQQGLSPKDALRSARLEHPAYNLRGAYLVT